MVFNSGFHTGERCRPQSRFMECLLPRVGYVHQCLHKCEPCGFSTIFSVSVATNVTARDARVTSRTNFQ